MTRYHTGEYPPPVQVTVPNMSQLSAQQLSVGSKYYHFGQGSFHGHFKDE